MKNKILTTAFISAGLLLSQGLEVNASITPDEIVELVNRDRLEARLPNLNRSSVLDRAAEAKADDMALEGYFSHTSPSGVTPWDWFREAKYEYRYAGENLAIHFRDAVSQERAWMESRKHCENILSPKYREIGVAIRPMRFEGKETVVAVQMFGTQIIDEKALHLSDFSQREGASCPKSSPSILGASLPNDTHGGIIGSVSRFLSDTASSYRIDTVRLSLLILVALLQISGLMTMFSLASHNRWLRR